jgi:hypothetical protein
MLRPVLFDSHEKGTQAEESVWQLFVRANIIQRRRCSFGPCASLKLLDDL